MTGLTALAAGALEEWQAQGLTRSLAEISSLRGARAVIDGQAMTVFSSSDYLGLSQHLELAGAAHAAIAEFGVGSTGSRLTTGTTTAHLRAEAAMADFVGTPAACFFATGYQANLSTIQTIATTRPGLEIFSGASNHASIIDGCRLARVPVHVFAHVDYQALDTALRSSSAPNKLVISDGLFSMSGALAHLPRLQEVCRTHGAWLMLDDAHAIGTLGDSGRGSAEFHRCDQPDLLMVTASKALGSEGAFVCASPEVVSLLRNRARSFVFSTAAPPASAAAITAALPLVPAGLATLRRNLAAFSELTDIATTQSPIVPIPIGSERAAVQASAALKECGLWVPAIRYPTVPRGQAILRVTITAHHTREQIEQLAAGLARLGIEPGTSNAKA